jgi:hypothetical protein
MMFWSISWEREAAIPLSRGRPRSRGDGRRGEQSAISLGSHCSSTA